MNLIIIYFDSDNFNFFCDIINNIGSYVFCYYIIDYGDNFYCYYRYSIYSESFRLFCFFVLLLMGKFKIL